MKSKRARIAVAVGFLLLSSVVYLRASDFDFHMVQPTPKHTIFHPLGFESEEGVDFFFRVRSTSIYLSITNKSEEVVAIDWNRCSITLPTGQTSNVMRDGQKYSDKDAVVPPTSIPPRGKITTTLTPSRNVSYSTYLNSWSIRPLGIKDGSSIAVYIALEVGGVPAGQHFIIEAKQRPAPEKPAPEKPATPAPSEFTRQQAEVTRWGLAFLIVLLVLSALGVL